MFNIKKEVQRCIEKYNLSEEEATRIIKAKNSDLSIQELRYKYDNLNLGKAFPDWITPENLLSMCYGTVGAICNKAYYWYYSADELAIDLFIWANIKMARFDNHRILKKALYDQCKTIIRDINSKEAHQMHSCSFNNIVIENDADLLKDEAGFDVCELKINIKNIADKNVQGILILGGYFIAGIIELIDLVVDLYNNSSVDRQKKLYELYKNDECVCSKLQLGYVKVDNANVPIGKILKVFKIGNKNYLYTHLLPYLTNCGFITA